MWIKILMLFMAGLFPCLSVGMCEPYDYIDPDDYIDPEVDIQWDFNQVFLVKDKGVTIDSFPPFCSEIDDKLAGSKNLNPKSSFMVIGKFVIFISTDEEDLIFEEEEFFEDVYFKVALIKEDGEIDMSHTGWIYMEDFQEMKTNGKIEHIKGKVIFQREAS